MSLPKIFVIKQVDPELGCIGFAMAEDGEGLVEYLSTNAIWARRDLGVIGTRQHDIYAKKYPDGYQLVDYLDATDEQLVNDETFVRAYEKNHQLLLPSEDEDMPPEIDFSKGVRGKYADRYPKENET